MDVSAILNYLGAHHTSFIAIGAGALGLSTALEAFLTKFRVESKKVAFSLLHLITVATSGIAWLSGASGKSAVGTYAGLTVVASFWHRFVVSDVNAKYVTPFLTWLANQKTATVKAAVVTPTSSSTTVGVALGSSTGGVVSSPTLVSPLVASGEASQK